MTNLTRNKISTFANRGYLVLRIVTAVGTVGIALFKEIAQIINNSDQPLINL